MDALVYLPVGTYKALEINASVDLNVATWVYNGDYTSTFERLGKQKAMRMQRFCKTWSFLA